MLSIFDRNEPEPLTEKKPTLDRLQDVLAPRHSATPQSQAAPAIAREEPPPQRLQMAPTPAAPREVREDAPSPRQFQRVAEQFTRSFLDCLTQAVQEIYTLVAEDRRRLEALHHEVLELSQRVNSLLNGHQEQIEKRLELQAGAIRTLHSSLQAREERLDKILSSFQALQNVSGRASTPGSLPENL
jgi:hypothetical protein